MFARRPRALVVLVSALVSLLVPVVGCSTTDAGAPQRRAATADAAREWDGIAYPVWEPDAYAGDEVAAGLSEIADLGASTVTIIPTWYVDDSSTSVPQRDPEQTPTDESLTAAIDRAHELGLRVLLKPHVDRRDDGDRAEIAPADPARWFERYQDMIVAYAELAQATGVEMFSVGTELAGTVARPEWSGIIDAVRAVYDGPLTYAANFDSYVAVPFWGALDVIGVDAYFELVDEPTTDVDELVGAWGPILDGMEEFAAGVDRPVVFTEAGYVSQVGSTVEPWNWEISDEAADDEQAAGYRALLTAVADRRWIQGVQWWMWDDLADAGEDQTLDYTPRGKPAEQVLRDVWG